MTQQEIALDRKTLLSMYERMILIRSFEDRVYDLFSKKMIPGTTHLCQGQEAVSVGVNFNFNKDDVITTTYRGHGHCLAKGVEPNKIMAELMGKVTGCCRGKGGSMHITDFSVGALGSFAIVGAGIPVSTGAALAFRYKGTKQVAAAFFGDGAANIGAFHEGLNMASIMKLPVIFICENNQYGEYSPMARTTPVKNIADRASAYGMRGVVVDGNEVLKVYEVAKTAVEYARNGNGPTLIEAKTYRHKGHSRTDPGKYRPDSEVQEWMARDPIKLFGAYLEKQGLITNDQTAKIKEAQDKIVEAAYEFAMNSPYPDEKELTKDVYGNN